MKKPWNRCDICGRFIPISDFERGLAKRELLEPDSDLSSEAFMTVCREHANNDNNVGDFDEFGSK